MRKSSVETRLFDGGLVLNVGVFGFEISPDQKLSQIRSICEFNSPVTTHAPPYCVVEGTRAVVPDSV